MTATHAAGASGMPTELAGNWWAIALRGALGILFGLITLFQPGATMLSLALVFAAYAFVDGILTISASVRAVRQQARWGYLMFEGIVDIVTSAIAVIWPGITVLAFVLLVAVWAIVTGALMIAGAFRQAEDGRWWLVFGGIVSLIYGSLLAVAPLAGAVVVTWWLGAYALVFGVALLGAGVKLRAGT